jgi:hypothetical protein
LISLSAFNKGKTMKNTIARTPEFQQDDSAEILIPLGETDLTAFAAPELEEAANDNEPLLEVVQKAVWGKAGCLSSGLDEGEGMPVHAARDIAGELDFNTPTYGRRGFLDEG